MSEEPFFSENQDQLARFAKALAHPVRVYIMELLSSQPCCFSGDLAEILPIARSTLSQHLSELKDAGLIQGTIQAPKIKYCINSENWAKARELFGDLFKTAPVTENSCITNTGLQAGDLRQQYGN
ncbi:MAG: metalloregulator ArsR/SmtB family transcription factor [Bacteroidota bacterium]